MRKDTVNLGADNSAIYEEADTEKSAILFRLLAIKIIHSNNERIDYNGF